MDIPVSLERAMTAPVVQVSLDILVFPATASLASLATLAIQVRTERSDKTGRQGFRDLAVDRDSADSLALAAFLERLATPVLVVTPGFPESVERMAFLVFPDVRGFPVSQD